MWRGGLYGPLRPWVWMTPMEPPLRVLPLTRLKQSSQHLTPQRMQALRHPTGVLLKRLAEHLRDGEDTMTREDARRQHGAHWADPVISAKICVKMFQAGAVAAVIRPPRFGVGGCV